MKSKMIILAKVLLKNGSGLGGKVGKRNRQLWIMILLAISIAPLVFSIFMLVRDIYDPLKQIQQEGLLLNLGFTVTTFMIFFFGVFYALNVYYFSNDVENLLALPLKPSDILGAKFITVLVYEYIMGAVLVLPLLVGFGLKSQGGVLYILYSGILFLLLPVIPLVAASILVVIIMRFTNIGKYKDQMKVVGGIIAIGIGIGINRFIQKIFSPLEDMSQVQYLLEEGNNSLLHRMVNLFPTNKLAALGLLKSQEPQGILNILLFVLISILLFYLFVQIGNSMYLKGVLGISETSSKRKLISKEQLARTTMEQSKIWSYTLKELRILFRTPIYFLNCVLINFLLPVFFIVPLFTQSEDTDMIHNLRQYLYDEQWAPLILLGGFTAIMFIISTNGIAATSISREGENFFVNKYLPISYSEQIFAKVLSALIIGLLGMTTTFGAVSIIFRPPLYLLSLIIITGLNGMVFSSFVGITIDLFNPKLHWDTEQQAVKQNVNVLLHMVAGMIVTGLSVFVIYILGFSFMVTVLLLIGLFGLGNIFLYRFLQTKGVKMFRNIES